MTSYPGTLLRPDGTIDPAGLRVLSVRQPYAEMIACGAKTEEYRSRATPYRGPVLICSGTAWHANSAELGRFGARGRLVCLVTLTDCQGEPGDYTWSITDPVRVTTYAFKGRLGLCWCPKNVRIVLA